MNRDQIITKTLDDMRCYENSVEDREPGSADRDAEYNRDVFIPEMEKRLPAGDIVTCAELRLEIECCPPCHGFYPHYDMHVVRLADGRTGWICCAVRRFLFPETSIADNSPEAQELMRALGGESSGQSE
jgi:hypothetical protein